MKAENVIAYLILCILTPQVWSKPQHNAEVTRSSIGVNRNTNRHLLTNSGEPFYGITVVRHNGRLRPSYAQISNVRGGASTGNIADRSSPNPVPLLHRTGSNTNVTSTDQMMLPNECLTLNRCKRDSDLVFPDALNRTGFGSCRHLGTTFCEEADDYPMALVEGQLRKDRSKFSAFFGEDKFPDMLTQRFNGNDNPEDVELCQSEKTVIYPRKGVTIDNDWKFIVNQNDGRQGVLIEICKTDKETKCAFSNSFPSGYQAYCKQHYVYRQLVSFSESGAPFEKDYFKMPSCCKCVLRQV